MRCHLTLAGNKQEAVLSLAADINHVADHVLNTWGSALDSGKHTYKFWQCRLSKRPAAFLCGPRQHHAKFHSTKSL